MSDLVMLDMATVIPLEKSEACFTLLAVDDSIVEDNEVFVVTIEALNPNDVINRNLLVMVADDDGKI